MGTSGAQQWTDSSAAASGSCTALISLASSSRATGSATARSRPKPPAAGAGALSAPGGAGAAGVAAGPVGQPPAAGLDLGVQVDEQRGAPAGQIGADAARRELRQEGEIGELVEDQAVRCADVGAGKRADAGGAGGMLHGPT